MHPVRSLRGIVFPSSSSENVMMSRGSLLGAIEERVCNCGQLTQWLSTRELAILNGGVAG